VTDVDVTPVWSLKALWGIDDEPPVDEVDDPDVVVVDDELDELHAATAKATATTRPTAAERLFREPERKAPPLASMSVRAPPAQVRADTNM